MQVIFLAPFFPRWNPLSQPSIGHCHATVVSAAHSLGRLCAHLPFLVVGAKSLPLGVPSLLLVGLCLLLPFLLALPLDRELRFQVEVRRRA